MKRTIFIAATDDVRWLKAVLAVETQDFRANDIYFSSELFSSVQGGRSCGTKVKILVYLRTDGSPMHRQWRYVHINFSIVRGNITFTF